MGKKNKPITIALDVSQTELGVQRLRGEVQGLEQTLTALQRKLAECFAGEKVISWLWQSLEGSGEVGASLTVLRGAFEKLAEALSKLLAPVAVQVIDLLSGAVTEAARLIRYLAEITGLLFQTDSGVQDITDSQKKLTVTAKTAQKTLQRSLMGFDELNRLQKKVGASVSATPTGSVTQKETEGETAPKLDFFQDRLLWMLRKGAEDLRSIDLTPIIRHLGYLEDVLRPHVPKLYEGISFFWNEILMPIARWTVEEAVPKFLWLLNIAVQSLALVLEAAKPILSWLWIECLQPLGKWAGEKILETLDTLGLKLATVAERVATNKEAALLLMGVIALVASNFSKCGDILGGFSLFTSQSTGQTQLFSSALSGVNGISSAVIAGIAALGAALVALNWDGVKNSATSAWQGIKNTWQNATGWFRDKVLAPLENGFRSFGNATIAMLNGILKGITSGINAVIKGINSLSVTLPQWIPEVGGKTLGFHLKSVTAPQIPYLAQGAVLPANKPFLAMVGDQKHGTNIEAPLATIQEAVAAVMQDFVAGNMAGHEATVSVLREILEAVLGISIGDDVIAGAVSRHNARMAVVKGGWA